MISPQWVSIEGIIGAGKSTLINHLTELNHTKPIIVEEPVHLWQQSGILQKAYENPLVWNFPAQCHFFTSRLDAFRTCYQPTHSLYVSERSAFSDILFWNTQLVLNRVESDLHTIYKDMWSTFQRLQPIPNPTLFVYLRPDLDECMRRMQARGRREESTVDLEYQTALYEQHEDIFNNGEVEMPDGTLVPCLVIHSNEDYRNDELVLNQIKQQIENKLSK